MRFQWILAMLIFWTFADCLKEPKLVFVQVLARHGARYPKYDHQLKKRLVKLRRQTAGVLTKQGKAMTYAFGQLLYDQYWDKLFGNLNHQDQSKFYFKSTEYDRTIQTLQSILLGVFENLKPLTIRKNDSLASIPPWSSQLSDEDDDDAEEQLVFKRSPFYHTVPIRIESVIDMNSPTNRAILKVYNREYCPIQLKWQKQNLADPFIKQIINNANFTRTFKILSKLAKKTVGFTNVNPFCVNEEALISMEIQPLSIFKPNSKHSREIKAICALQMFIRKFHSEKQLATTNTGYFNSTVNHFKRIQKSERGVQWITYSAHHSTVMNFATRLGLTSAKCVYQHYLNGTNHLSSQYCILQKPPFASSLVFQLYKHDPSRYTFKVRYNGQYRRVPLCGWQFQCDVEKLYEWYNSWKDEDYTQTCQDKQQQPNKEPDNHKEKQKDEKK